MKGFIEVTRARDGVNVLLNISKIRIVAPSASGCSISLDNPVHISQIEIKPIPLGSRTTYEANVKPTATIFETTTSYQDVLALIEQANR
jgi:hypothetical protein